MEDKNILKIRGTEVNIETTEDLKKGSVFQDEYDHAFLVVQGIINRNMEKKEKEDYRIISLATSEENEKNSYIRKRSCISR